jgi:hypothetical protein
MTQKKSTVQSVRRSGLELVPCGKPKGKLASARDFAKLNWKPWKHPATKPLSPSPDSLEGLGVTARLAYATMLKSRADLIEMHQTVEHETVDKLMAGLFQAAEDFKALAKMIESAYARILAAGEQHALAGGEFKFQDGSSRCARMSEM